MPPLLSARTCWRAGWAVVGLGPAITILQDALFNTVISSGDDFGAPSVRILSAVGTIALLAVPAGLALLAASVVVRHVERLTAALVASGTIQAPPPVRVERPRADGDLDETDAFVVEHEPGVR